MDFDFLDRQLLNVTRDAVVQFKNVVEGARPNDKELRDLCKRIRPYPHTKTLEAEFVIAAVDGSGEFPALQQDDVFLHFAIAAGAVYRTDTHRQHKLSSLHSLNPIFKQYVLLSDDSSIVIENYKQYLHALTGMSLKDLVKASDYCKVYNQFSREKLNPSFVTWERFPFAKASQVATHAYLLRSMAELGMALRMLESKPRYLLLDTSLVYFFLGEQPYLPELLKRALIARAAEQGAGVVALCKSHNVPNGDLIARQAKDEMGFKDHWYLRLPSEALGEPVPVFLQGREIPPKLSVSYLFKFHSTSFPMRIDVDATWWQQAIGGDEGREQAFFGDLDFTCHEVRSFGYPYPMHAAHRSASLTKQERRALKDILLQHAQREGLMRGVLAADPEQLHMGGM
jgi:hypothetical protein